MSNPQDATIRNTRAGKKRDDRMLAQIREIESRLTRIESHWQRVSEVIYEHFGVDVSRTNRPPDSEVDPDEIPVDAAQGGE